MSSASSTADARRGLRRVASLGAAGHHPGMVAAAFPRKLTADEYLALERTSETKHEFWDGEIFAMAGAREAHNLVVANLVGELRQALRTKPCRVYPSDMRVAKGYKEKYVYPDVSVVCGEPRFESDAKDTMLNPSSIIEVLSASTEAYDRGKKFELYRAIESVKEYVLAATDEARVEHFVRGDDGSWTLRVYGPGTTVALVGCGVTLAVDELYLKVEFEVQAEAP